MTLMINNKDVMQVLTMKDTMAALEESYRDLTQGEAVCRGADIVAGCTDAVMSKGGE